MSEEIVNRVANSALLTLNLEDYFPKEEIILFDLKNYLFMELILKEKDFREALLNTDWTIYTSKIVALTCSADAIIPVWAYMLVTSYLQPVAADIILGDEKTALQQTIINRINKIDTAEFTGKKIVVKGCGELPIGDFAYLEITKRLLPVSKSIMYGEPCSTVPIYKKR